MHAPTVPIHTPTVPYSCPTQHSCPHSCSHPTFVPPLPSIHSPLHIHAPIRAPHCPNYALTPHSHPHPIVVPPFMPPLPPFMPPCPWRGLWSVFCLGHRVGQWRARRPPIHEAGPRLWHPQAGAQSPSPLGVRLTVPPTPPYPAAPVMDWWVEKDSGSRLLPAHGGLAQGSSGPTFCSSLPPLPTKGALRALPQHLSPSFLQTEPGPFSHQWRGSTLDLGGEGPGPVFSPGDVRGGLLWAAGWGKALLGMPFIPFKR